MIKRILFFTGAGIDKESGIETFRDGDNSTWNNYKIEDVATPDGWRRNKEKVLDFYNQRRRQLNNVEPNIAHKIIAELEKDFDVTVVTQNVSDLHERAGSTNVIHLHGNLKKVRSTIDSTLVYDCEGDCNIGDKCDKGSQLRPSIIWFNENLDPKMIERAEEAAIECDFCIIVGTSMQVAPANQIPFMSKPNTAIIYIDPSDIDFFIDKQRRPFFEHIKEPATVGVKRLRDELYTIYN